MKRILNKMLTIVAVATILTSITIGSNDFAFPFVSTQIPVLNSEITDDSNPGNMDNSQYNQMGDEDLLDEMVLT